MVLGIAGQGGGVAMILGPQCLGLLGILGPLECIAKGTKRTKKIKDIPALHGPLPGGRQAKLAGELPARGNT